MPTACRTLCTALLVATLAGCSLVVPLRPPEEDLGPCPPDLGAPLACAQGLFLAEDFEQPALVPAGWTVDVVEGKGYVTIHRQNEWFAPSGPGNTQFLMFDPQAGCCGVDCPPDPALNTLTLTSPLIAVGDCSGLTVALDVAVGHMEAGQDLLRVETRSDGGDWTLLVDLFSPTASTSTMYQWQTTVANATLAPSQTLQLRIFHQSQCWNDNAAVDNIKLAGVL